MTVDNVAAFLAKYTHQRIDVGKSGAEVWTVGQDMLLKYARRREITDTDVWRSYEKEARMYAWFRDNGILLAPVLFYERQTPEEIVLLIRRYRMLAHDEAALFLPEIMRTLAEIHSLPVPDFLERPKLSYTALSQDQVEACHAGWESVLAEHGDRFALRDAAFVAEHFNTLNERFYPQIFVLIHGDFHCDNLLLEDQGGVIVCDWQNVHIGTPASDIAFFLSRLSADGVALDMNALLCKYCTAASAAGLPADAELIRRDMTLSSLNAAFLFWHQYLHKNPPERVGGIFEKMVSDTRWLLEKL